MARAIIVRGEPVYCNADVRTWNEPGGLRFFTRTVRSSTRAVMLHHTGGEGGGEQVHRTLVTRRLSVHFTIDQLGTIWQYVDADAYCQHAGKANPWSVGVEIANRARAPGAHPIWTREECVDRVHGRNRKATRFYAAQIDAALELVRALCSAYDLPIDVPRDADGKLVRTVLPANDLAAFRGVCGHYHANLKKVDPGTEILCKVAESGGRPA